jgi:probable inactive serine/threonine-protein kinase gdt1
MNDIDFEELDRAINSVLSENEKKASAKNDPAKKNKSFKNENLSSNKNKSKNNDNEKDNHFIDDKPIKAEDNNSNNIIVNNLSSSTVQDSKTNVDDLNHSKDVREDIKTGAVDIPQHFNSIIGGHDNNDNDLDKIESDKDAISIDKVSYSNNIVPPLVLPHRTSYSRSGTQSSLHARSVFSRPSVQSRAIFRDTKLDIDKNISGANSASPIAKSTQSEASISKHDSGFMENNALKNSRDVVGNFSVSSFSGSKKLSNDSSEEVIINKPTKLVTSSVNKEDVVSENNTDVDDSIVKDMTIKMVEELNAIKNESISEAQDKITIDNSIEKEHQSIDNEKQNQSSHHRDSTRKVGRFMDIMHPAMDMRHSHSIKPSVSVSSNLDNTNNIGAENFHDTNLDNLDSKVGDNDNSLRVSDSENTIDDESLVDEKTELKSHSDDSEELDSTTDLSTEHTYNNDNFNQQDDNQQSSNYDFIDDNYVDQYNTPNLTGDNTTVDVIDSTKDSKSDVHPIFDTESYTKPLTQNKQNKFNIWVALIVILIGLVIISIILLWKIIYA